MTRTFTILFAAILAVPAASATWNAYGSYEPDTALDSAQFMFFNDPTAPGDQIYFNAFQTVFVAGNPNVATTQSRMDSMGARTYQAMLGQWVDCNSDGYVGLSEKALEEYPSALLDSAGLALCPDGTAHNAGGWVTELKWIGYDVADSTGQFNHDYNNRMIIDQAATVWGDEGLFSDSAASAGGGSCPVSPVPRGTFQSTGGFLQFLNCEAPVGTTMNTIVFGGTRTVVGNNVTTPGADPTNSQHLGYTDPNNVNQAGPLNVPTFGSEDSQNAAVTFDCSGTAPVWAPFAGSYDSPTSLNGINQVAYKQGLPHYSGGENEQDSKGNPNPHPTDMSKAGPRVIVPGVNPNGDVPASLNQTFEAEQGDCNSSDDSGHDFYGRLNEGDNNPSIAAVAKTEPKHEFSFSVEQRGKVYNPEGLVPQGVIDTVSEQLIAAGAMTRDTPQCFGVYYVTLEGCAQDLWSAHDVLLGSTTPVARTSVAQGTVTPSGPHYATFFATVSSGVGTLPTGSHKYGEDQCTTIGAGQPSQNGWNCDPAKWYHNANGSPVDTTFNLGHNPTLGVTYHLRDVDCYDGHIVTPLPVFAGAGQLGPNTCDQAP